MRIHGLRMIPILVVAGLLAAGSVIPAAATHTPGAGDLLPDLQTLLPQDLEIVSVRSGRNIEKRLRFDNEVLNRGTGPLELYPDSVNCDPGSRMAIQRIYQDSGLASPGVFQRGDDNVVTTHNAGCMRFHPQHRHWHFDDFAKYELKTLNADGTVGGTVEVVGRLVQSTKVSFCIIDVHHRESLPGSPASAYYTQCGRDSTLGISIGWSDEYHSTLAGQYVDITGVANGTYCLVSTADPLTKLADSNRGNNVAGVRVTINGGTATAGSACAP